MNSLIKASGIVGKFMLQHSTTILKWTAVVGVGATAYTSGKAAISASKKLEELEYTSDHKPTKRDQAKCIAKDIIPPVIMATTTIACIIALDKVHVRNSAALAMACTALSHKYTDLSETMVEELGKRKTETLKDKAAQKRVTKDWEEVGECGLNVIRTRFGNVLFKDCFTGRYFYSSYEAVDDAIIKLTHELQNDCIYVTLNRFYDLLEIPTTDAGDNWGWDITHIADTHDGKTTIEIFHNRTTQTPDPWCLPCTVIDYDADDLVNLG